MTPVKIGVYAAALAAGLAAGLGVLDLVRQSAVQTERARVETEGKKIDAKAQKARATAVARPAPSVLDGQWRD